MVQDSASRKLDQYIVRFPDGMRDFLKDDAAKNGRSLNAEIIARLEASITAPAGGGTLDGVFESALARIADRPNSERHIKTLTAHFEDYKRDQIQNLREFLILISKAATELDMDEKTDFEEISRRQLEAQFERLRGWANTWGYEIIDKNADQ